ncbi:hypothetical protein [Pseudochrobactrum asaccharolyticum]|uniref:Uncharacterized protein n=1 Tax=Pseudochrobactrum asaccharolyticum TaxID=354351 RepID=A0A366DMT5_9HYPH|nr:hypothetical protein [Pseudochrobactrum asaccharolyticum]RBO90538.1 hypothetical protein DFR47_1127 [Pseudochrobactrum asaccharolyticum]
MNKLIEASANEVLSVPENLEPIGKSKRFWTRLTAAALPALGMLDWRVQLVSVVIVGGLAGYAIYSMPPVQAKIAKLIEAQLSTHYRHGNPQSRGNSWGSHAKKKSPWKPLQIRPDAA